MWKILWAWRKKEEATTKKVLEKLSVDLKWNSSSALIVEVLLLVFAVAGRRIFSPEEW